MSRTSPLFRPAALALLAVLALAGCSSAEPADTAPVAHPSTAATPSGSAAGPAPSAPPAKAAAPSRITISSIGVDSSLMPLGLQTDGTVEVPPADKGMTAGWYTGGAVPGERGASVIIGHNSTRFGRAVFHDLREIAEGADITVRDAQGKEIHFKVTGRETASKQEFPTKRVYGTTGEKALRLVTCDGAFDAQGHPVDNLIVYATRT